MNYHAIRTQTLVQSFKPQSLDTFLVTCPVNIRFLTGFSGSSSSLIITPKKSILISDDRYVGQIEEECPGVEAVIRHRDTTLLEATIEVLSKMESKTIGIESGTMAVQDFESIKTGLSAATLAPIAGRVESIRAVKDPSELEVMREAVRLAERA
ncbi:MAG: aminopeptidase P family N-terminal domain-containing protein, partial [Gemmataceae bacterium]